MAEILITREAGNADFEKLLSSGRLADAGIALPNNLKNAGAMGVSMALTQLLLTWRRSTQNRTLKTWLNPEDLSGMEAFSARVHGLAATYFADSVQSVNGLEIKRAILESARQRIKAMHVSDVKKTARGPEIEFIFIQGAKAEFHGALYSKAPSPTESTNRSSHGQLVEGPIAMNALIGRCVRELGLSSKMEKLITSQGAPLGWLLHEAFRNTAEHGYQAPDGSRLMPNLRCVRMAQNYVPRDDVAATTISAPAAQEKARMYFKNVAEMEGAVRRETIQFFEISVFDSGCGFAPTIASKDPTAKLADVTAVVRCFLRHSTAKSSPTAGLGLNRILREVHEMSGFLRVRTNTVEAFYAPVAGLNPDSDPTTYVHGGLANVQGTLLTVAIPVGY